MNVSLYRYQRRKDFLAKISGGMHLRSHLLQTNKRNEPGGGEKSRKYISSSVSAEPTGDFGAPTTPMTKTDQGNAGQGDQDQRPTQVCKIQ